MASSLDENDIQIFLNDEAIKEVVDSKMQGGKTSFLIRLENEKEGGTWVSEADIPSSLNHLINNYIASIKMEKCIP